ncbi:hypothetical protein ACRRTK_022258 [Alexandromys fortis]
MTLNFLILTPPPESFGVTVVPTVRFIPAPKRARSLKTVKHPHPRLGENNEEVALEFHRWTWASAQGMCLCFITSGRV